jgi:uncharacterized protein YdiU (UPF0061 family)
MSAVNPAYIPRNHRVEAVIKAAVEQEDFAPFDELMAVLARPFDDQPALSHCGQPPAADERVLQTFQGNESRLTDREGEDCVEIGGVPSGAFTPEFD